MVETPARIAPTSRIRRVSLRVSMPSIATTPRRVERLPQRGVRVAGSRNAGTPRGPRRRRPGSDRSRRRRRAARSCPASASRHRHDLPGVGGIRQDLLVAGHPGVEDRLSERLAVGAEPGSLGRPSRLRGPGAPARTVTSWPSPPRSSARRGAPCERTRPSSSRPGTRCSSTSRRKAARRSSAPRDRRAQVGRAPGLDRTAVVAGAEDPRRRDRTQRLQRPGQGHEDPRRHELRSARPRAPSRGRSCREAPGRTRPPSPRRRAGA